MSIDFQAERRSFLGRAVLLAGGVAAGSALPVSLLQASPVCVPRERFHDPCGDWTLDDQWNAYPPYAFRHDAERPRGAARPAVQADPLDALFMVG